MSKVRLAMIASLAAMTSSVIPATAAQLDLSPSELCAIADVVAVGEVTDLETLWSPGAEGRIERRAFLSVGDLLRGTAPSSLEIVLPGGEIGQQWHWVEDVPTLRPDAAYVVFLGKSKDDDTYRVIGGESGAVRVAKDGLGQGVHLADVRAQLEVCLGK